MSYSKEDLVQYRIERSLESYEDGKILAENARWNAAANRLYYASFFIISAYLAQKELKATTHSGLKASFNKVLVKPGIINENDGKLFNKLFDFRQKADYEDFVIIDESDVKPLVPKVKSLIDKINQLIKDESGKG